MVELKGIEIKYGDFIAMNELDLKIEEGEFFTLLGPSGCGKTSLLRTITGFVEPSKGSVVLEGKDVTDVSVENRGVGIVFQSYAIFPTMNVFENIAFGLRVKKLPKKEVEKRVLEIAKMVDLKEEHLYRKASSLSGGQQQRVAIARALILKPKILCLDEPLSNLDAQLRHQLRLELKKLQMQFGITTIYVTHDQEEALTMSDRIAVFDNGKLEQLGTPNEIFYNPKSAFVANFIGDINRFETNQIKDLFGIEVKSQNHGKSFLRLNSVKKRKRENYTEIEVTVVNREFYGFYTKYEYTINGLINIKNIDTNTTNLHNVGDVIKIYINENDFIHL